MENRFGSVHTLVKLAAIENYLPAYTTALKNQRFTLHYVDAFAGTGLCKIKISGDSLTVPGSASIALACEPPFHKLVFIEKKKRKAQALARLAAKQPRLEIAVIQQDANEALLPLLQRMNRNQDRAVVFLDPFGMSVEWSTLKAVSSTGIVDLWYLFPLSGLYRQAAVSADGIDEGKAAAITRMMGTDEWRTAFYEQPSQSDMFTEKPADIRTADPKQMLDWVKKRLETIFPGVAQPKVLYQKHHAVAKGPPLFALFFAVSNENHKARALALKIANGVLNRPG